MIKRDNHYVPQFYLRSWVGASGKVLVYTLLVPDDRMPHWRRASPRGIAYHRHLYTAVAAGEVSDEFERWIDQEFEAPAAPVFAKLHRGVRLTRRELRTLARFAVAQDVRTPARYIENRHRWVATLPGLIDETLESTVRDLSRDPSVLHDQPPAGDEDHGFPLRTTIEYDSAAGQHFMKAEISIGRKLWLASMRHTLTQSIKRVSGHFWTILEAPRGLQWPTTDDPVVRMNYRGPGDFDFQAGWGSPGSEILFPLTPSLLLYTRVGKRPRISVPLSVPVARQMISVIVARAHRMVFCTHQDDCVVRLRPRIVNRSEHERERLAWREFGAEQEKQEREDS